MSDTVEVAPASELFDREAPAAEISLPPHFHFDQVQPEARETPTLGPLEAFVGGAGSTSGLAWHGTGFNTIFRPDSLETPTKLKRPVKSIEPETKRNTLELNLTRESMVFAAPLGRVPNRGTNEADSFLNGVPYVQTVYDVTTEHHRRAPLAIHFEPGLWMCVPPTAQDQQQTLARMGSIPHGTTILAQGTAELFQGAPPIPAVSILPFVTKPSGTHVPQPGSGNGFPSLKARDPDTQRIPQDLDPYIAAGTITQAMLDDPNTLLRAHISGQTITSFTMISISTAPALPLFGGGTQNIAFLLGNAAGQKNPQTPDKNAQALQLTATFWIESVQHKVVLPAGPARQTLTVTAERSHPTLPVTTFIGTPPEAVTKRYAITVESTQIQYSQMVLLNFNGITWPHVSVATLVPASPILLPESAWQ